MGAGGGLKASGRLASVHTAGESGKLPSDSSGEYSGMLRFKMHGASLVLLAMVAFAKSGLARETIDLAGQWRFAMDRDDTGAKKNGSTGS